jgi:DNA-3-methyladenine glycosylase
MNKKLDETYFQNEDVCVLASDLLGKVLCTSFDGVLTSGIIVETEAYAGAIDKASHAYGDKKTKRTATMYLKGGLSYVYLIYGMHHLFNVVSNKEGIPHAILIRAIEPIDGISIMLKRRGGKVTKNFTYGPGTLSQALGIKTSHDKFDLQGESIWIEDRAIDIGVENIKKQARIGVDYAEDHALWEWNYYLSPYVEPKRKSKK